MRPETQGRRGAERDKVEIRLYTVSYDAVEDMKKALEGCSSRASARCAGGRRGARDVQDLEGGNHRRLLRDRRQGERAHMIRLLRDNVVIHTGKSHP